MTSTKVKEFELKAGSKVLVTGGTGFTGRVLVKKLLKLGVQLRVIARTSPRSQKLQDLGCEVFEGQVYDPEVVRQAMVDVEYVFHVAAAFREPGLGDEVYRLVHVDSTQHLAEQALKQPAFKRFIHVSTIGVHGHIEEPPANEEYRYAPGDIYQQTKLEGELWLRSFAESNNLPLVVMRPATIYGPGDTRLLKLFKLASKPVFPLLGWGPSLLHLTHVDDLTDALIVSATHPNALNQVFICGDIEPIKLKDLVETIATENGNRTTFLRLPATPFFILGYLCELFCKPFNWHPVIFRRRVAFYTKDRSFNTEKLHKLLGHKNQFDNSSGLRQTLKWYKEKGWLSISPISFEFLSILV